LGLNAGLVPARVDAPAKRPARPVPPQAGPPRLCVVQGEHEATGRSVLAREWFDQLSAPSKEYAVFDRSGHTPPYDEPGRFADYNKSVVDQARPAEHRPAAPPPASD